MGKAGDPRSLGASLESTLSLTETAGGTLFIWSLRPLSDCLMGPTLASFSPG